MPETASFSTLRTEIAGVPVEDIRQQFGTPTYVYDAARIRQQVANLKAFDVVRYAQKACSNLAILDLVRRAGAKVDAVSGGEIQRALAAGYDPADIVYTADIFTDDVLDLVVQHSLHTNCGSPDMIDQIGERTPGSEVTLRINPGFGHGHSQKTNTGGDSSKHGIWHDQIEDCKSRAARHNVTIAGLHMHIGSGTDMEHLAQVCGAMEKTAIEVGESLTSISAGGGLPTRYRDEDPDIDLDAYYALWDATRTRLAERFGHAIELEIEPGRYLSAESGYLVAEIRAIKQMGDNTFYLVDAGFHNLARPILYGAYHPMSIVPGDGATERETRDVVVGGPLCESGDIFTQEEGGFVSTRNLPDAHVGELLVIECAGAYGFVMSSNYNSHPTAAEVLIDNSQADLIRARQTFEDLVRGERVPGNT
ncbi:MAG: diaminopimelate decarboxylase [Pirellulales bacterium]|nr:diaminopimelate decarboxylase [Pirellulales bacterium]